jgi:hypothetical protein
MNTSSPNSRRAPRRRCLAVAFLSLFLLSYVHAQTWTGGAGSGSWNDGANWGGTAPTSSATTDLIFAGHTQTTTANDIANPFLLRDLTFNGTAGAFTLGGYLLQVHRNVINNSTATQTIANNVVLGANSQWNAASGDIRYVGNFGPTNAFTLSKTGSKTLELTGNNDIRIADKGIAGGGTVLISGGATTNGGLGTIFATTGGANRLVITNGADFVTSSNTIVGNGGNSVIVAGEGSTWSGVNTNLYLYLNNDARLVVMDGAVVTNMGLLRLSESGNARMSVVVTNGAHLSATSMDYKGATLFSLFVGGKGASGQPARLTLAPGGISGITYNCVSNTITVAQDGILTVAGGIYLGYNYQGSGQDNRLVVTNGGRVTFGATSYIGYNSASNCTAWIGGVDPSSGEPSVLDGKGAKCMIGYAAAKRNSIVIDQGGIMTNGNLVVGDDTTSAGNNYALQSALIVTNGGRLYGTVAVGVRSRENRFVITGTDSVYNAGGATLSIGAAANNGFVVDGGTATNVNEVRIGYLQAQTSYAAGNNALITNGGRLYSKGTSYIGNTESYVNLRVSDNRVTVTGAGSLWDLANATLRIGYANYNTDFATNNALRVEAGGVVTNVGAVTVGYNKDGTATSVSNRLELAGGSFSSTSLRIYPNNRLSPEIGPDGIVAARVSGTATLDAGSLVSPSALPGTPAGTYKVLEAGTLTNNGLVLDPAVDSARWKFNIAGNALFVTYSRPGMTILVR